MKKLITLGMITICFYANVQAQSFGFRTGVNAAKMTIQIDEEEEYLKPKTLYGLYGGFFAEFKIKENLAIETGVYGSQKGLKLQFKEEFMGSKFEMNASVNLLYLDIPILAKGYINAKKGRFYAVAGPSIGIGIQGKSKYSVIYDDEKESGEEKIKWGSLREDQLNRFDVGAQFGIGYEINKFQVGIQYNFGLKNTVNKYHAEEMETPLKNRVFTFYAGYRF